MNNLYTLQNPKSIQAEAFRILRTNLHFASAGEQLKTIVITSAAPEEGKSTTSINLAITLAQSGKKVLLIDCDLRKSSIHKYLLLSNKEGLTNMLSGMTTLDKMIQDTVVPNFQVITAGPTPPNPAELLDSKTMKTLIEDLEKTYDYIILDSPPIVAVTDGVILSTLADGTILVISSGETPIDMAQKAKENLTNVKANILGVVLNNVNINNHYYYYYKKEGSKRRKTQQRRRR